MGKLHVGNTMKSINHSHHVTMLDNTLKIPKKIHFIFLAKNEMMPDVFKCCIDIAKELHPDWEINFYDEDNALQIIQQHFPELENLYRSYPLNVQRADIFRILVIYLYGGFYMDLDIYCLKKLDPLLKFNVVLAEEKHLKREVCTALGIKNPKRVANYMFGSIPRHPFWLDFLNEVMDKSLIEIKNENDVLESTGSGLLTDFYHSKADSYKDIVLLLNKDRICLNGFHKEIACHFGNYAAHLHTGTWRWQNGQTPKFNDGNHQKNLPAFFENSFRYKKENNRYRNFYFNQTTTGVDVIYNNQLANAFKNTGIVIENLADVNEEKVVLYGPIHKYIERTLPKNIYAYCSSSFDAVFSPEEVDFINSNFSYCIVPTKQLKKQYELKGIVINTQIIEPGFRRYKRDFGDEHDIKQFKLGCFATAFDVEMLRNLLRACKNLKKEIIPSIRIKLYDPNMKFKDLYTEFEESGVIDYTSVVVNEDFFSDWFRDLVFAIFGSSNEPWPGYVLEFLYMGIPVIIPDTDNYKHVLNKINVNPAVFFSLIGDGADISDANVIVENIEKAILDLYLKYDYYDTNALNASEELEDIYTIEDTEQHILNILSEI